MKSIKYSFIAVLITISFSLNAQVKIDNTGYNGSVCIHPTVTGGVGSIGNSTYKWYIAYFFSNPVIGSDLRIKTNIKKIDGSLMKVIKLNGITYELSDSVLGINKPGSIKKDILSGFIAQDVNKIIPEVIDYDKTNDSYGIRYGDLIPYLVEAIKEQQTIIDGLSSKVKSLEQCCNKGTLKSGTKQKIDADATNSSETESILYQNEPNPFNEKTVIRFSLPETVKTAAIFIYDMQGTQKKSLILNEKGNGSISISGNELEAGMYLYSLFADGKEVDTKRMILTK